MSLTFYRRPKSCIPANAVTSLPGIKVTLEILRLTDIVQVQTIQNWLRGLDIPTMLAIAEMSANPQSQKRTVPFGREIIHH